MIHTNNIDFISYLFSLLSAVAYLQHIPY